MTLGTVGTVITPPSGLGVVSRAELRRAICRELQMPFFRRFKNGYSTVAASPAPTTTTHADNSLTQDYEFWNEQWWYSTTNDEVRLVTNFDAATNKLQLEYAATLPVSGDIYELHSIWNAYEIHAAINRAIEDAYPTFFDVVTDESLVLKEDTLEYSLSSFTYTPWIIAKVWVENPTSIMRGTASSATSTSLTDSSGNFAKVTTAWKLSIYDGTGAGQIRSVTSVTGTTQINVAAWTTTPDTTSKYALWDASEQRNDWTRLQTVRFNAKENPTKLYIPSTLSAHYGLRLRVEYISQPVTLTTEASVTTVPKEFIIHRALFFMFNQKVNDNRADRSRYEALAQRHYEQSELYKQSHAFNMPDLTVWTPQILNRFGVGTDGDPFGWGGYN